MKCIKEKCRYYGNNKFWGTKSNTVWTCGLTLHTITDIDDECNIDYKIQDDERNLLNLKIYRDFILKN